MRSSSYMWTLLHGLLQHHFPHTKWAFTLISNVCFNSKHKNNIKKTHTALRASPHIAKQQLDSDSVHPILPLTKSKMSENTIRGDVKSGQMTPIIKGADKKEKIPFIKKKFTVEKWKHWATSYAPLHKKGIFTWNFKLYFYCAMGTEHSY